VGRGSMRHGLAGWSQMHGWSTWRSPGSTNNLREQTTSITLDWEAIASGSAAALPLDARMGNTLPPSGGSKAKDQDDPGALCWLGPRCPHAPLSLAQWLCKPIIPPSPHLAKSKGGIDGHQHVPCTGKENSAISPGIPKRIYLPRRSIVCRAFSLDHASLHSRLCLTPCNATDSLPRDRLALLSWPAEVESAQRGSAALPGV